jgi:hypothetical protein
MLGSSAGAIFSLSLGLYVDMQVVGHGLPHTIGDIAVVIGILGSIIVPSYVTKRLLVDYW